VSNSDIREPVLFDDRRSPFRRSIAPLDYCAGMVEEPDSVVIHAAPFGAIARAAGSASALALTALITATATMLEMSAATDVADAKLYSSRGVNNLEAIRWAAGTRLIVAAVALLLAILAGVRYSRDLPATRYPFSADGQEVSESTGGAEAPGWVRLLVGSSVVVSVLAILLNAFAFALALGLHESRSFGLPQPVATRSVHTVGPPQPVATRHTAAPHP
jgi:hypothetical protein